jgi:hypothetical protein
MYPNRLYLEASCVCHQQSSLQVPKRPYKIKIFFLKLLSVFRNIFAGNIHPVE